MLENAVPSSESKAHSFASLLAGFASATNGGVDARLDELEEDVATISYQDALRKHARHRLAPGDRLPQAGSQEDLSVGSPIKPIEADSQDRHAFATVASEKIAATIVADTQRKASVTVRLSEEECTRLHARAAEAGLSISAYLRSCIFEAESLRRQVKEALADIRAGTESNRALPETPSHLASPTWRMRFLGGWARKRQASAG